MNLSVKVKNQYHKNCMESLNFCNDFSNNCNKSSKNFNDKKTTSLRHNFERCDENQSSRIKFQAQPVPISTYHPKILLTKNHLKKTSINKFEEFHLYSMKRGEERAEFNKKLKEKEEMLKEIKKQQEAERLSLEKLEILKLRRQTIFKAKPIRK